MASKRRRTREEYGQGLYDYHDPLAGIGGAAPARSALTLRLWLAGFGAVFCGAATVASFLVAASLPAVLLLVLAVIAVADFGWVLHRKRRGEPG